MPGPGLRSRTNVRRRSARRTTAAAHGVGLPFPVPGSPSALRVQPLKTRRRDAASRAAAPNSTGNEMLGWRLWVVGHHSTGGQRLVSPFVTAERWREDNPHISIPPVILDTDGILRASCVYGHETPPQPGCVCGVHYCDTPHSLLTMAPKNGGFIDLKHPAFAFTLGEVHGPLLADEWLFPEVWNRSFGGRHAGSARCAEYRVRAILGLAVAGLKHYGVPVYEGAPTERNMQSVERRWRSEGQL